MIQNAFQVVGPNKTYSFYTKNEKEKEGWMSEIQQAIDNLLVENQDLEVIRSSIHVNNPKGLWKLFTPDMRYVEESREEEEEKTSRVVTGIKSPRIFSLSPRLPLHSSPRLSRSSSDVSTKRRKNGKHRGTWACRKKEKGGDKGGDKLEILKLSDLPNPLLSDLSSPDPLPPSSSLSSSSPKNYSPRLFLKKEKNKEIIGKEKTVVSCPTPTKGWASDLLADLPDHHFLEFDHAFFTKLSPEDISRISAHFKNLQQTKRKEEKGERRGKEGGRRKGEEREEGRKGGGGEREEEGVVHNSISPPQAFLSELCGAVSNKSQHRPAGEERKKGEAPEVPSKDTKPKLSPSPSLPLPSPSPFPLSPSNLHLLSPSLFPPPKR
eukprot:CAMPEP_0174264398 /NCGR_PEP_ID=MMETSP0439-20130205/22367_1 /TAXON_ID=0 /ORGANISM="Stereomyxa ramosa, Strain Chinc5" /LENGTH=377 /DNA_ID=CAMNT_0015350249 /DNA_START=168 /DNA_END=1297 /DNA_ORIENTATION=-